jgi:hypothetical protein
MTDDPFYAPGRQQKPATSRPGELLWSIRKDGRQLDAELRDHRTYGVELQVFREREFLYGRTWLTRALALEEADALKARYLAEGGVLLAESPALRRARGPRLTAGPIAAERHELMPEPPRRRDEMHLTRFRHASLRAGDSCGVRLEGHQTTHVEHHAPSS